jgi:LL-diaminopimelate aminotransferase
MKTAARLERFPEYVFSRLAKNIAAVEKESGRKVKNFGIGSPDVPPSPTYLDKLNEFTRDKDAHLYPGYTGIKEFRAAVAQWYKKRFGAEVNEDEVLPLLGAKDGVSHLPFALADEGSEILMPDPGYPGFSGSALLVGATPTFYGSLDELESKITDKTAFIWINFPNNPTGAVVTMEELEKVVAVAKKHDVTIVYDNAYSEITFDGYVAPSILQIPGAKDICVEMGSFSKTFSFAGNRMGWIVGNKRIVEALSKVKSQTDSGMWLPLQRLGAYALQNQDMAWHAKMIATYQERRDIIAEKLRTLGLTFDIPKGSLYLWAKIPDSAKDSETYVLDMLKEKQVFFAPGSAFGKNGERYVRVSICVDVSDINDYL